MESTGRLNNVIFPSISLEVALKASIRSRDFDLVRQGKATGKAVWPVQTWGTVPVCVKKVDFCFGVLNYKLFYCT